MSDMRIAALFLCTGLIAAAFPAAALETVRVDVGVSAKVGHAANRLAPDLLRLYATLLDAEPHHVPTVTVAWEARDEEFPGLRAELSSGDLRVILAGRGWADPNAASLAAFNETLAAGLARTWSASIHLPDAGLPAWVAEGSAELLGTAALLRSGALDATGAARRVNVAFNNCFVAAGARPWAAMARQDSADVAKSCGLAIHFVVLALAQRRDPALDAFAFWRALWKAHPRYGVRSIVEHLDAAVEGREFATEVLLGGSAPIGASLAKGVRVALGVELPNAPPHVYASQVVNSLMSHDCGGRFGFWTNNDHLYTDEVRGCSFFKGSWKLRYLAGRDLLREPQAAIRDAIASCAGDRALVFRTLDGEELRMPCDAATAAVLPVDLRVANLQPLRVARVLVRTN